MQVKVGMTNWNNISMCLSCGSHYFGFGGFVWIVEIKDVLFSLPWLQNTNRTTSAAAMTVEQSRRFILVTKIKMTISENTDENDPLLLLMLQQFMGHSTYGCSRRCEVQILPDFKTL